MAISLRFRTPYQEYGADAPYLSIPLVWSVLLPTGIMAEDVGDRLKIARKARGLTQKQAAERLHVTDAAVQHHESGKNDPSLPLLAKYARIYKISTDWIIMGKGKGPTDARDPREALLEVWDEIAPSRQPQALAVLQTFLPKEKQSA